jgi:hypothetical protein
VAPRDGLFGNNVSNRLDCQTSPKDDIETKGISGAVTNPVAFPLVIAEWDRNSREVVRVALDRYNGWHTVNARVWYRDGDTLKPSKSGITLALKHLPLLADALARSLDAARELGLLDDGGVQ